MAAECGLLEVVSVMLDKAQSLDKIVSFLQLVSHLPGILERINIDALLEEIVVSMGWNPQKMLAGQASPSAVPAVGGTQPAPADAGQPGAGTQTPAQISAGIDGRNLGGSNNNPQAIPPQAGGLAQQLQGAV